MANKKLKTLKYLVLLAVVGACVFLPFQGAVGQKAAEGKKQAKGSYPLAIPLGLEDIDSYVPSDNPLTPEKVELGRLLFFDKRLSKDNTIACASCHLPGVAFTDGQPVATGIRRQQGGRSAPASINRLYSKAQFWDGRAATLEEQSIGPFINPIEHGFADHDEMIAKMKKIEGYRKLFQKVFGTDITIGGVGKAIASFQRTILSGNSPADQFDMGGNEKALSPGAQRGLKLFRDKARCTKCHSGFNFTDEKFHNLGIGWDNNTVDLGRYMVTKNPQEIGAFKTPTLREIPRTAPYMHDGRFGMLEDVVNFYNQGGIKNPHQDELILPLKLTDQEKHDLVEFLQSLKGEGWQQITAPTEFPQ